MPRPVGTIFVQRGVFEGNVKFEDDLKTTTEC